MVKYGEGKEVGRGGSFRVEKNPGFSPAGENSSTNLGRFGSLAECIECVIAAGAYISFGRTSDGGATLIRVLDGRDKLSSYCSSHAEVLEAMEALRLRYNGGRPPLAILQTPEPPKRA